MQQEADTEQLVEIFKTENETKEELVGLVDSYWGEISNLFG